MPAISMFFGIIVYLYFVDNHQHKLLAANRTHHFMMSQLLYQYFLQLSILQSSNIRHFGW